MRNDRHHATPSFLFLLFALPLILGLAVGDGLAADRDKGPALRTPEAVKAGSEEIPDWIARWELARVLSYLKRYDESTVEYRKLIKEKPSLAEARAEMAQVLFWQGRPDDALEELERIPPASLNEETREILADLYRAQKRYDKAESLYQAILARNPDHQKVRLKLAEILSWAKRYDESLAEYGKILTKRPQDVQVRRKYAFVLIWAGRHAEGARELKQTLP